MFIIQATDGLSVMASFSDPLTHTHVHISDMLGVVRLNVVASFSVYIHTHKQTHVHIS